MNLDLNATVVNFVDALGQEVRYGGACFGQMLTQVDAERRHFARQPLVAALDRQALETLLVASQAALA